MNGKYAVAFIVFIFLTGMHSLGICQSLEIPNITELTQGSTSTSIDITWERDSDADFYKIWIGTDRDDLSVFEEVRDINSPDRTQSTTIEGLDPDTTYFVAVSAVEERFDGNIESNLSPTVQVTTGSDDAAPDAPTGFQITGTNAITSTSVELQWDENTESDLDFYLVKYGTASRQYDSEIRIEAEEDNRASVTDLTQSTRFYFTITAVDELDNESNPAPEIIVDSLPDTNPPNIPGALSAEQTDVQTITITIDSGNENMADFAGNIIYFGEVSGQLDESVDIGKAGFRAFRDLPQNATRFFAATAYDSNGNESELSAEISATVQETQSFLDRTDEFEGGCFVGSLWDSDKTYNPADRKNKAGAAAGYYLPEDSEFEDFYGDENYPVFLFYDRLISQHLSLDFKAGYLDRSGKQLTLTGAPTQVSSSFTLVPVAASINYNIPLHPYIWAFVGLGPDYWYVREETEGASARENSDWVGGYHGRAGFWLYNTDPRYQNWGGLFEVNYASVDRFGGNDTDIGGWFFLLGLFYSF